MEVSEAQLKKLKKYISVIYSTGLEGGYTPRVFKLESLDEDLNGYITLSKLEDGSKTITKVLLNGLLHEIASYKNRGGNIDVEYNEFLSKLKTLISIEHENLTNLNDPKSHKAYMYKTKSFIAFLKRSSKANIKYYANFNN